MSDALVSHSDSSPGVRSPESGSDAVGGGVRALLPAFPPGEFYSCTDPESLSCTSPGEALEEYLDADLDPRMTAAEVVKCIRARPITVTAYKPMEIADKQIDCWADDLYERLDEAFSDEHGDPDGPAFDLMPEGGGETMREAVRKIIRGARVWACDSVGKVTLTPDQIEAVMREYRPDWFSEPSRPPAAGIVRWPGASRPADEPLRETEESPSVNHVGGAAAGEGER